MAFARVFEATAQDDALDVLDLLVGTLLTRVENEGDQARLRTLRDRAAAALRQRDACRVALDPRYPDREPREAMLVAAGGEERLEIAVTTVTDLTRPPEDHYYEDLLSRYSQLRQFLHDEAGVMAPDGFKDGRLQHRRQEQVRLMVLRCLRDIGGTGGDTQGDRVSPLGELHRQPLTEGVVRARRNKDVHSLVLRDGYFRQSLVPARRLREPVWRARKRGTGQQ